jgi:hypothetical protein
MKKHGSTSRKEAWKVSIGISKKRGEYNFHKRMRGNIAFGPYM